MHKMKKLANDFANYNRYIKINSFKRNELINAVLIKYYY